MPTNPYLYSKPAQAGLHQENHYPKTSVMKCSAIGCKRPLFGLAMALMLLSSCATNPVTGKKELMLLSKEQEKRLGAESDPQIIASYGRYDDQEIQDFIQAKGEAMARISHRPELDYEFKVLDAAVVNAFALPGGYVYFTRGILAYFNNEAQFAGVLGHEIGHITARHSANQYSRQVLAQVGLAAGAIASPEFAQYADAAGQGLGLLFLKFGRDDESESDRLGVEYATKIGYDAGEMAAFFATLKRLTQQSGSTLPTFLSTHPDPADRNKHVKELARRWKGRVNQSNFEIGRNSYLRMIEGLVYGEDPRQGYVEGGMFYHPELKFSFPIPGGWRTANAPTQVQMAPEDGRAVLLLTLAQESSLSAATSGFKQKYPFDILEERRERVNGLPATVLRGRQVDQQSQQAIAILAYLIEYGGRVYQLLGMSYEQDYNTYASRFQRSMQGFDRLTDASKLNVKPERIKIRRIDASTDLRTALQDAGIPDSRLEEFAILNGMQLTDPLSRGTLIKVIEQ